MKLITAILILLSILITISSDVYAQNIGIDRSKILPGMGLQPPTAGQGATLLTTIIRNLVTIFYSVGALGFTIMVIWGSVNWILSGGDKEKIANARKKITTALIGLFLLALSFPIISLIAEVSGINILGDLPLKKLTAP